MKQRPDALQPKENHASESDESNQMKINLPYSDHRLTLTN